MQWLSFRYVTWYLPKIILLLYWNTNIFNYHYSCCLWLCEKAVILTGISILDNIHGCYFSENDIYEPQMELRAKNEIRQPISRKAIFVGYWNFVWFCIFYPFRFPLPAALSSDHLKELLIAQNETDKVCVRLIHNPTVKVCSGFNTIAFGNLDITSFKLNCQHHDRIAS